MLNPFFLQGSKTEQGLIQDLINEQLRMYGVEVYYLPRKYITEKTIIKEVIESAFDNAYPIEAYVENFDGYGDNTTILSKFGIQALNELTIIISKERFEEYISPLIRDQSNIKLSSRPKEGDLIYFPLGDRLFEIKFVEHEQPFYQLQKNYVYTLKCELFRYEDEIIDTSISFIDDNIGGSGGEQDSAQAGIIQKLNMVGTGITASAITNIVNGGIRFFTITNRGSGYINSPRVAISSAPSGGVSGIGSATLIGGIVVCTDSANPATKSVQSIEVINPGFGYTVAPKVLIFGDGSGATATSTIGDGVVGVITVTNSGGGYINSPSIIFTGISSVSAAATAVVSSAGSITQIRITNTGLGYTQPPSITIGNPSLSSLGSYTFNEIITGSTSGTTARVRSWSSVTNVLEVSKVSGEFIAGETLVGTASSASRTLRSIEVFAVKDGYSDNETIEEEADSIIDFSNKNPFGMP
ncbi:MAG TPA: hypothetical protein VMX17_16350 [Candidatus Glassbacteria bacterium]|nr:hypothetical protein [Candidatus Glassbacteria bacterium]